MDHSASPRNIDVLLARYAESHRNHTNEIIHFVCIPLIVLSLLGILWAIHPAVAIAATLASLYYYTKLSRQFALGMGVMSAVMLGLLALMPDMTVLPVSIAIFVVAWIGQFIGHKIEGKKPSFFEDLRFLLIGPLFVLSFLYRRMNLAY
ncbi:Mpo1 family 2-hydroxy fatty acid dioxygenase [Massilia varians]